MKKICSALRFSKQVQKGYRPVYRGLTLSLTLTLLLVLLPVLLLAQPDLCSGPLVADPPTQTLTFYVSGPAQFCADFDITPKTGCDCEEDHWYVHDITTNPPTQICDVTFNNPDGCTALSYAGCRPATANGGCCCISAGTYTFSFNNGSCYDGKIRICVDCPGVCFILLKKSDKIELTFNTRTSRTEE